MEKRRSGTQTRLSRKWPSSEGTLVGQIGSESERFGDEGDRAESENWRVNSANRGDGHHQLTMRTVKTMTIRTLPSLLVQAESAI